jgi:type I restriction enzyme M protein
MARPRKKYDDAKAATGANLGYEAQLWKTVDALRNNMDAAEYRRVRVEPMYLRQGNDLAQAIQR